MEFHQRTRRPMELRPRKWKESSGERFPSAAAFLHCFWSWRFQTSAASLKQLSSRSRQVKNLYSGRHGNGPLISNYLWSAYGGTDRRGDLAWKQNHACLHSARRGASDVRQREVA